MRHSTFIATLLGTLWLACSLIAGETQVVAEVNGEPITAEMLSRELARIHATLPANQHRSDFSIDRLVERLVNDLLISQEARSIGLDAEEPLASRTNAFLGKLAARAMVSEQFPDTFTASDREVEQLYRREYEQFEFRMLSLTDSLLAVALADSIRHGASMRDLIETYSIDRYADTEGVSAAYTYWESPPAVRREIPMEGVGHLIGPVQFGSVQSLIRIERRFPPDPAGLDSLREGLRARLSVEKRMRAIQAFTDEVRARTQVVIHEDVMSELKERIRAGAPAANKILATVADRHDIPEKEIRESYLLKLTTQRDGDIPLTPEDVLNEKIDRLAVMEEAYRLGYAGIDSIYERAVAYEDSLLVLAYLEGVIAPRVKVDSSKALERYLATPERYHNPPDYIVESLTSETREDAEENYARLLEGADFAWVSRQHNSDRMSDLSTDEWLSAAAFPAPMRSQLDTLPVGGVTRPIAVETGYMIIHLKDRREGALIPYDRVADNILFELTRQAQADEIDKTIRALREASEITIHEDMLKSIRLTGTRE